MSVSEKNVLLEVQDEQGNSVRQFPYTKADNVLGLAKLIKSIDNDKQLAALLLLATNSYLVDEETQDTYRLGIKNGELFSVKVDYGVQEILNQTSEIEHPDDWTPSDVASLRLLQEEVTSMSKRIAVYNYDARNKGLVIRTSTINGGSDATTDESVEDDGE